MDFKDFMASLSSSQTMFTAAKIKKDTIVEDNMIVKSYMIFSEFAFGIKPIKGNVYDFDNDYFKNMLVEHLHSNITALFLNSTCYDVDTVAKLIEASPFWAKIIDEKGNIKDGRLISNVKQRMHDGLNPNIAIYTDLKLRLPEYAPEEAYFDNEGKLSDSDGVEVGCMVVMGFIGEDGNMIPAL